MQALETLRDHLSSIVTAQKYDNEDVIRQILDDFAEIDSMDLDKEMLTKTRVALPINKLQKLPKNAEVKQKAASLFSKIGQIMKSQAPAPKKLERTSSSNEEERSKHRRLFAKQLKKKHSPESKLNPDELATEIENELNKLENANDQFMFLINTITDEAKDNAFNLCHRLLMGELSPKEFVQLTQKDLITEEELADFERIRQEKMHDLLIAQPIATKSSFFTCRKCKSNNVSSYALQTRSADEPMTNFCECLNCGNKWRE